MSLVVVVVVVVCIIRQNERKPSSEVSAIKTFELFTVYMGNYRGLGCIHCTQFACKAGEHSWNHYNWNILSASVVYISITVWICLFFGMVWMLAKHLQQRFLVEIFVSSIGVWIIFKNGKTTKLVVFLFHSDFPADYYYQQILNCLQKNFIKIFEFFPLIFIQFFPFFFSSSH